MVTRIPLTPDQEAFLNRGNPQPQASHEAFEGAKTSRHRSALPQPNLAPGKQIPSYTRQTLLERFTVIRNNMGLMRRLVSRTVAGAVGNGISPKSTTTDAEWNKAADEWFHKVAMSKAFDLEGRRNFYKMQASVCADLVGPGESFTNIVQEGTEQAKFQLISPQHIKDGGDKKKKTIDGLVLDPKTSAVLEYCYSTEYGKAQFLSADGVLHVFDMERSGQYRGLPWCYHGINSLIDVLDLVALEKASAKIHSALAAVVKKASGTVGTAGLLSEAVDEIGLDPVTGEETKRVLEKMLGGQIPFLAAGEELQLLNSTRQSAVFAGHIDWLEQDICVGYGLHREYIKGLDLGGTDRRFAIDEAQTFFDSVGTMIIDEWSAPVRVRMLSDAMRLGLIPQCNDNNWPLAVVWQRPARGTVDRGREANAMISLMDRGLLTSDEYHGSFGNDGAQKDLERIKEVARQKKQVKEIADQEGVFLLWEEVFFRGPGIQPIQPAQAKPATPTKPVPAK